MFIDAGEGLLSITTQRNGNGTLSGKNRSESYKLDTEGFPPFVL